MEKQAATPAADRGLEVGVAQNDVGRLAAELLGNSLDRVGGGLGDNDSGPGRTGERHHVDVRMARHRLPDVGPGPVD